MVCTKQGIYVFHRCWNKKMEEKYGSRVTHVNKSIHGCTAKVVSNNWSEQINRWKKTAVPPVFCRFGSQNISPYNMTLGGFNKMLHTINTLAWHATTAALTNSSHSQPAKLGRRSTAPWRSAHYRRSMALGMLFWAALNGLLYNSECIAGLSHALARHCHN